MKIKIGNFSPEKIFLSFLVLQQNIKISAQNKKNEFETKRRVFFFSTNV